jgi:glutamate--cysteine ligase
MDPGRTKPPPLAGDADLPAAWAAYALDAQVMCVREDGSGDWSAPPGLRLRDWLRGSGGSDGSTALRAPTTEDLTYHLSTLFPPVRPRGHFELRMIDAQPDDGWVVPLAVASALLSDAKAAEAAMAAAERLWHPDGANGENPWLLAASVGPAHPRIARASRECFAVARDALVRHRTPADILAAVDDFIDRYVSKDRCPADDLLEELG